MNLKRLKNYLVITLLALVGISASAQTAASAVDDKKQTLFSSANHASTPYRIPAIATMSNGEIIAIADQRPCGADVGNGDVDIYAKFSNNNGAKGSWTPENIDPSSQSDTPGRIANGGTGTSKGYGDAAVAADPSSGKVVFMCVGGGNTPFASAKTSTTDYLCIRNYSEDYGRTWKQTDVTSYFKGSNNVLGADVASMFFGSGKLAVSKKVPGRIYGALLVRQVKSSFIVTNYTNKNYVVYSNDWGASWKLLGDGACCSDGDEPKVEELPNGDILLSSRASGARYFNVFKFTNIESATGSWETAKSRSFAGSNSTNGEILLYQGVSLKNDQSGAKYNILLQSIPTGSSRSNVSVYYKAFAESKTSWEVSDFTSEWTKGIEVDNGASAYSTMTIMPNGEIGFLYEDNYDTNKASGAYSDIVFVPLTVEEITGDAYTYVADVAETIVATPVISPASNTIKSIDAISITCATDGATIYYTTDGTEPTVNSTKYTGQFTLSADATVKAIAVKEGLDNSEVATRSFYVIVMPEAGKKYRFVNVQKGGAKYYFSYTATDGLLMSSNEADATVYTCGNGTTSGTYKFQSEDGNYLIFSGRDLSDKNNRGYNEGKGFLSTYDAAKCDLTIAPMEVGGEVESFTGSYVTITGQRDFTKKSSWSQSTVVQEQAYFVITSEGKLDGATEPYFNSSYSSAFLIEEVVEEPEPAVAAPVFSLQSGTYEEGTELTISCPTEGARIFITIDGTTPTIESIEVPNGFSFELGVAMTIKAIAVVGENYSEVVTVEYLIQEKQEEPIVETVATPTIIPYGGEIDSETAIRIICNTEGATIHYTTDGTEPTEESAVYDDSFTLDADATVKAIAVKEGWNNSAVVSVNFIVKVVEPELHSWTVNIVGGKMNGRTRYMAPFSAPCNIELPNNVKAYYVKNYTSNNTTLTRIWSNIIPAYQGVILEASAEGEITITAAEEWATPARMSNNKLVNTADGPVVLESDAYVFEKNSSTGAMTFYKKTAGTTIPQNSCYLVKSGSLFPSILSIDFDEDSEFSGINDVNAEDAEVEYYNLQGVKVENPEKGIYIMKQGGKTSKVVL